MNAPLRPGLRYLRPRHDRFPPAPSRFRTAFPFHRGAALDRVPVVTGFGRRVAVGAVWSAAESWGRQAATFAVFALLAWILGPSAYGLMALALAVPLILTAPVTRGLPEALIQRPEVDALHFDSAFWLLTGAGLALAGATVALAPLLAELFGDSALTALIRWTSLTIVFSAIGAVPGAVLKRDLHFRLFAIRSLVSTLAGGSVGIGMALAGFGVWSLVALHLVRTLLEALILLLFGNWRPRWRYAYPRCRELFPFARPVVIQSCLTLVNDEAPKVVIGFFLGPHAVGIYTLARRLLDFLSEILLAPQFTLAFPALARVQTMPDKVGRLFAMLLRLTALPGVPACVGLAVVAPDAVPLAFGEAWLPAVPVVQIMMVIGVLRTVDGIAGVTLLALGHASLLLRFHLASTVLAPVLIALGAPFGLEAAVGGLVLSRVILLPFFLFAVVRVTAIDVWGALRGYPRILIASAVMVLAIAAFDDAFEMEMAAPLRLAASIGIGACSYGLVMLLIARRALVEARDALLAIRG